jgi:hypothetical protein
MKLALLLGSLGRTALPGHAAELPILADRLPSKPSHCLVTGGATRPGEAFLGKPALLVIAEAGRGVSGELAAAVEALQQEFAPWLGWGAVLAGNGASERAGVPDGLERLRLDACWVDADGSWRSALAVGQLPAVMLVNEDGYVVRRQTGWRAGDEGALRLAIERLAGAGRLRGRAARDFKLEQIGTGKFVTLADVATREYTLLFSLRTDCGACFDELGLLDRIRRERREQVTLVAIDHDPPGGSGTPSSSWDGRLPADLLLRDPELRYGARYGLDGVPALVVVDGAGQVVFARQGFHPDERAALGAELRRVIDGHGSSGRESLRFAEFRRVRAEGLALLDEDRPGMAAFFFERALELFPEFHTVQSLVAEAYQAAGKTREAAKAYGHYLACEPLACDREHVLRRIRTLAAVQ